MFKHFCHQHCCAFRVVTHPMWPFWFKSGWSRQCLKEIDFGYSTTVLGKEGAIDFLDSSPWPFSIIDAFLNINETQLLGPVSQQMMEMLMEMLMMITNSDMSHLRFSLKPHPKLPKLTPRFTSYDTYEKEHPVTPPRVSLASVYWQPTVSLDATSRLPHRIRVAVVGSHATLSLEPVDMLRRFLTGAIWVSPFFGWFVWLAFADHVNLQKGAQPYNASNSCFGMLMKYLDTAPAVDMNRYECFGKGKNGRVMDSEWLKVLSLFVPKLAFWNAWMPRFWKMGCLSIYTLTCLFLKAPPKDSSKERVP